MGSTLGHTLAAVAVSTLIVPAASARISVTNLGMLPAHIFSAANANNNRGSIVGYSCSPRGENPCRAFLWRGSMMELLGPSDLASNAIDVNDQDQVVGVRCVFQGEDSCEVLHAFLWSRGVVTDLGTLGGSASFAFAINNRGQVVGSSSTASGESHAFLWEDGVMVDLGTAPGDSESFALDINDRGQIVGVSQTAASIGRGVVWENTAVTVLAAQREGSSISPTAINNRGQIVGTCGTRPCMWDRGTPMNLGALSAGDAGALDINNRGEIVGWSETASGRIHAVRWARGRIEDLEATPDGFSIATAVNDRGDIVGSDNLQALAWWNRLPPVASR